MENYKNPDVIKIEELRNHIRNCIIEIIGRINKAQQYENDYAQKNKNWAISIFLLTVGFCLKEYKNLGQVFIIIPFIPIGLFLAILSLKLYMIKKRKRQNRMRILREIINNLYYYSFEDLKKKSKILYKEKSWPHNGEIHPPRLWKEKIPGIIKNAKSLENVLFFGGMALSWITILIIYFIDNILSLFSILNSVNLFELFKS